MKKRFNRRKFSNEVDVDITSLLDILTILLVFLLKSYNASDLKLDLTKNLEMADSKARSMTRFAPVVQIDRETMVFLNSKKVGRLPANGTMTELTNLLKEERTKNESGNLKKQHKLNAELINLIFDRDMDYQVVQNVMHSSALAGYSQFKFIVRGNF